jgi:cell envelope-related function transcriptional attenuator common domain
MRRFLICLVLCSLFFTCALSEEIAPPVHPLMFPDAPVEALKTPRRFFNLLVLGIDFGGEGYRGSGNKAELTDCHTDAVMVVAMDLDEKKVSLVSVPRDTVAYVPGVRGVYKLNSAVNCGATIEEGLQLASAAVSRILGGLSIDAYCAVDFAAMIAIGDAIGGVDFELEMAYSHYERNYKKGLQHLDGLGIADYFRARTNATVGKNDLGRTNRQRELLTAMLQKLMNEPDAPREVMKLLATSEEHFFTNISTLQAISLMPFIATADLSQMGSYVLEGPYATGMGNWNFTFTNQQNRIDVIKAVWGATVPELPYCSKKYTEWLESSGFSGVHAIVTAQNILTACSDEESETVQAARELLDETMLAFTQASYSQKGADITAYGRLLANMKKAADKAAKEFDFKDYNWNPNRYFYANPLVNEVQLEWR